MTATPVRTDKQDVTEIFGNNLIHEITREEATEKGWICAFEYRLYKDNVDYDSIFWNGWKYREEDLNNLLNFEMELFLEIFRKIY